MPWQEKIALKLKEQFIHDALSATKGFAKLCRANNISRKTGYKWLARFKEQGLSGLENQSRCPARLVVTSEEWVNVILEARDERPAWGARKLRQYLINQGHESVPCESTFNRILKRHHRIDPAASEKRKPFIRFERTKPMELLQMDFKGHFRTGEGSCHPLTVIDDHSRFALCLKGFPGEKGEMVMSALTETFREYGLPKAITMDNGSPWKGHPPFTLSKLTIWLMRLGIRVCHSTPYHPQTQGKAERFHRSLKEEVLRFNNFQTLADAQDAFDHWRSEYNYQRPHEGIEMKRPCDRYEKSSLIFPEHLPPIEYNSTDHVRTVGRNGVIDFKGHTLFIGEHFFQERVALRESEIDGVYHIYFFTTRVKKVDLRKTEQP